MAINFRFWNRNNKSSNAGDSSNIYSGNDSVPAPPSVPTQTGTQLDPRNKPSGGGGSSGSKSGGGSSSNNVSQNVNAVNSSKSTPEEQTTKNIANNIKEQLLADYPKLENSRNVNVLSTMLATGKIDNYGGKKYGYISDNPAVASAVNRFDNFNVLANKAQTNYNKKNTVTILTNENNKVTGVEYGGQSFDPKGFEKSFGVKILTDPKDGSFFFGTSGTPEIKRVSTISGGYVPITEKEKKDVKKQILNAKIVEINKNLLSMNIAGAVDVATDKKLSKYLTKEGNWAYDKITSVTTNKLSEYAQAAKEKASEVLRQSDFNTGNKKIDITAKSLGYISYFGGSAGAYALNMISGLGNVALGLAFKPTTTAKMLILAAPAMIKNSAMEIGRTVYGKGTIEDFFGAALTMTTVAQTTLSLYKLASKYKSAGKLGKDAAQIRAAISQSQSLLKKQQLYMQKIVVKDSNKWQTFGKSQQYMKGMNAKHSWHSFSNAKASVILQKSIIQNKNVRMINYMMAKSTTNKILGILKKYNNGRLSFSETFMNTKKVSAYLSKVQARRLYTFVEVRGSKVVYAIDGKGAVKILNNNAEIANFIKNANYGKFSFTGSRAAGGSIEYISRKGKNTFLGSEAFSWLANKKSIGMSSVVKQASKDSGSSVVKYSGGKKTPFSATFGKQTQQLAQVQLPKNVALSKGLSNSVVSSQLKGVSKAITKAIRNNNIALRTGFKAVVSQTGSLIFLSNSGKIVSAKTATNASTKAITRVQDKVVSIVKPATKSSSAVNSAQGSSQASSQKSAQKSQQTQRSGQTSRSSTGSRVVTQMTPKFKFALPDKNKNNQIVKKILGNKLAPSYQIYIGSGKKVKKLGGRYSAKEAISKGTYTIDRTKERTIRIVPTKQKPNARFKMDYLQKASTKFRNYRIRQGKRVKYSSTRLIEKSKYFNDLEKFRRKRK